MKMKIQIVTNREIDYGNLIGVNSLNSPMSFDDYDVNVVDLTADSLWRYRDYQLNTIDAIADFKSVGKIVTKTQKTTVVYVLPQNCPVCWYLQSGKYKNKDELKNHIPFLVNKVLMEIIPLQIHSCVELTYERNRTIIAGKIYDSDFFFSSDYVNDRNTITKSTSGKSTTIKTNEGYIITTCNIMESRESIEGFINEMLPSDILSELPDWVENYSFYDDIELKKKVSDENEIIREAQCRLGELNNSITKNNYYKSVLYTTGDQLVKVVFEIIQIMLNVDLSKFKDEFKEDFLIELPDKVFVGEIKGVNANVQYGHIDQAVRHFGEYADNHPDYDENRIKPLLIINRLRNTPISDRETINIKQINHAEKNNCLIVDSSELLKLFEKVLSNELSSEECVELLFSSKGELVV